MKLPVPFIQLPVLFDAAALAAEVDAIEESAWRGRTANADGNSALVLIATNGDPDSDELSGRMRPTPTLQRCPLLTQVLHRLGATWGRARLMRLSGQAEVRGHVDVNYYWRDRMRVHVPIVTTPSVRFHCGDAEVNMGAGECWVFDTWRRHRVLNEGNEQRIHLVADTVGGAGLWQLLGAGRPHGRSMPDWQPQPVAAQPMDAAGLDFESVNAPVVMSPWEIKEIFVFLLAEATPHPALDGVQRSLLQLARRWHALWSCHGEHADGWPRFNAVLDEGLAELHRLGVGELGLRNEVGLLQALQSYVFDTALAARESAIAGRLDRHGEEGAAAATPPRRAPRTASPSRGEDPQFDRPVFIVSSPRSGSTLLFETLMTAPDAQTIGGESHQLIERIPGLAPGQRQFDSNRLLAADASPAIVERLRSDFLSSLRDRDGRPVAVGERARMLEKTPKNALRIPFLRAAFPEARFIFLHRDPRQVWSSMLEGWQSGRFRTYPDLPGWSGLPWSFLLVPGWRELAGQSLPDIIAEQWERTTRIMLDDLAELPADDWLAVDYGRLLDAPQAEVERICGWADWRWDRPLGARLPLSRTTVSPPDRDKWRQHAKQIEPRLAARAELVARAEAVLRD